MLWKMLLGGAYSFEGPSLKWPGFDCYWLSILYLRTLFFVATADAGSTTPGKPYE
jgi:hypothetical protein